MFGRQGLFSGTLTLGFFRGLAQLLGVVQFAYFLHVYGSDIRVDALFIAQTIPFLFTHFFGQPVTLLFVPVFVHMAHKVGSEEAWRFASAVLTVTGVVLCALTALTILTAPWIVAILAPGFEPQEQLLAAGLLQWMAVLIVLNGLSGPARSLYYAHESYVVPAVTTVLPSLGIIAGIFLLSERLGIYAYIVGGIVGSSLQLAMLWLLLNVGERRIRFQLLHWHSGVKEFFALLGPRFMILGLGNVNGAVDRAFASGLGAASISAMGYAITITDAPTSWLRTTFGGTIVPVLSKDAANENMERFKRRLLRFLGIAVYLMTPCSVLLLVLSTPMIQTLFQRGKFDASDSALMSLAAFYYAIGLVPAGLGGVIAGAFFSLKDTMTPFKVSCGLVFLNVVFNVLLIDYLGLGGLALATSLVSIVRLFVFLHLLKGRVGAFTIHQAYWVIGKMLISGAAMAVVLLAVGTALGVFAAPTGSFLSRAVPLGITCCLGLAVYLFVSWLLRVPLAQRLSGRIQRKFAGRFVSG